MSEPSPRSVLLVRPSALGDVCRSVPVLAAMRGIWPEARLGWLVQSEFTDAIRAHPDLDEIIPFPRSRFRGAWKSPRKMTQLLKFMGFLRRSEWDMVIDCQGLARSALFARLTRSRTRTGFSGADEAAWIHYTNRVSVDETHAVDRMMGLLESSVDARNPDMRLYTPDNDVRWWNLNPGRPNTYVVFAPKSRWASKEWPGERWVELAEDLSLSAAADVILTGSAGEREAVDRLAHDMNSKGVHAISLAGRTSIGQTMAVIEKASLVVANDSAPMHMAVGFGRPLVGLFGPTDPSEVGPYGRSDAVIRPRGALGKGRDYRMPSEQSGSMADIEVAEVLEAAIRQMEGRR